MFPASSHAMHDPLEISFTRTRSRRAHLSLCVWHPAHGMSPKRKVDSSSSGGKANPKRAHSAASAAAEDDEPDVVHDILRSTAWVMSQPSTHVTIDEEQLIAELKNNAKKYTTVAPNLPPTWGSQSYHYAEPQTQPERTAQYVLVLDALNFCFWPLAGYEYEHLVPTHCFGLSQQPLYLSLIHSLSLAIGRRLEACSFG